jgi:hypothetical protein
MIQLDLFEPAPPTPLANVIRSPNELLPEAEALANVIRSPNEIFADSAARLEALAAAFEEDDCEDLWR